jgi:hypothetical protein
MGPYCSPEAGVSPSAGKEAPLRGQTPFQVDLYGAWRPVFALYAFVPAGSSSPFLSVFYMI